MLASASAIWRSSSPDPTSTSRSSPQPRRGSSAVDALEPQLGGEESLQVLAWPIGIAAAIVASGLTGPLALLGLAPAAAMARWTDALSNSLARP